MKRRDDEAGEGRGLDQLSSLAEETESELIAYADTLREAQLVRMTNNPTVAIPLVKRAEHLERRIRELAGEWQPALVVAWEQSGLDLAEIPSDMHLALDRLAFHDETVAQLQEIASRIEALTAAVRELEAVSEQWVSE